MGRRLTRSTQPRPLVSVVLCTYNRARLVRRAIRSVQAQRYTNWQLVIVDDGSTDRTPEVLAPLPARDGRIVVLRQSNRGLSLARNAGLHLSDGTYICFLDSDDEFLPTHIGGRVALLQRSRTTDMVYGGLSIRGPMHRRYVVDLDDPRKKVHVGRCFVGGTFFMRQRVVKAGFRFRDMAFGEDLDFVRRVQRRFTVRKVKGLRTYVYHCETADRLCDTFTRKVLGREGRAEASWSA